MLLGFKTELKLNNHFTALEAESPSPSTGRAVSFDKEGGFVKMHEQGVNSLESL
jgi:hypothetical protein